MALIRIEYGSLASSDVMNNNFEYLDDRMTGITEEIQSNNATINSNISSLSSQLSNQITQSCATVKNDLTTTINANKTAVNNVLTASGLYITTYTNGNTWYREYFSNSGKTARVWLEQGGRVAVSARQEYSITYPKAFTNLNYNIVTQTYGANLNDYNNAVNITYIAKSTFKLHPGFGEARTILWRACGK